MHQQIRTSTGSTGDNIATVIEILATKNVDVLGVGPDFKAPHIRVVVGHPDRTLALDALRAVFPNAAECDAVTIPMPNRPGYVHKAMAALKNRGFAIESLLVLAGQDNDGRVRVSFGVQPQNAANWEADSDNIARDIAAQIVAMG